MVCGPGTSAREEGRSAEASVGRLVKMLVRSTPSSNIFSVSVLTPEAAGSPVPGRSLYETARCGVVVLTELPGAGAVTASVGGVWSAFFPRTEIFRNEPGLLARVTCKVDCVARLTE